jgi:hypothetical protein
VYGIWGDAGIVTILRIQEFRRLLDQERYTRFPEPLSLRKDWRELMPSVQVTNNGQMAFVFRPLTEKELERRAWHLEMENG